MCQEAREGGWRKATVQERAPVKGGQRRGRIAPPGYPREGAGKFFPLGCRQKGNYFNCGQPRSTKLHPHVSAPSLLSPSTCEVPHTDPVSLSLFLSSSFYRVCLARYLSPRVPSSLFYILSEGAFHPSATAGCCWASSTCTPLPKLVRVSPEFGLWRSASVS